MKSPPKPNTQALSWFYGENEKGTLDLTPKYQRNPIWSIGQKCFLIDSLISGCPLPQVFVNIKTKGTGQERQTIYEIVDGQQRLRAILEFMKDTWPLVATTANSYPVSEGYKPHIGKRFSELPGKLQDTIWNYPLAVQELRGWGDLEIRALFRRLNYVVERLNKQELRHSQYFGAFVNAVEKLTQESFWDDVGFFSRRDSQRMKDVEFVSELFVLQIAGVQDQQKKLDEFYADYDVDFPKRTAHMAQFRLVLGALTTISDLIRTSRYKKKADFYGLFGATCQLQAGHPNRLDLSPSVESLSDLADELEKPVEELDGFAALYHATVIEGPNKRTKRLARVLMLKTLLMKNMQ